MHTPRRMPRRTTTVTCLVALAGAGLFATAGIHARTALDVETFIEPAAEPNAGAPTDAHLAFLEGTWRADLGGSIVEEHWFAPSHGTVTGMLRWFNPQGEITLLELLTVQTEDGRGVFRWRHFDADLTPWDSEADGPSIVVIDAFEGDKLVMSRHPDSAPSAPARMIYDGSTPGRLIATLEFDEDSGRGPIVITFERVE